MSQATLPSMMMGTRGSVPSWAWPIPPRLPVIDRGQFDRSLFAGLLQEARSTANTSTLDWFASVPAMGSGEGLQEEERETDFDSSFLDCIADP